VFTAESAGERCLKIGQHLAKVLGKNTESSFLTHGYVYTCFDGLSSAIVSIAVGPSVPMSLRRCSLSADVSCDDYVYTSNK